MFDVYYAVICGALGIITLLYFFFSRTRDITYWKLYFCALLQLRSHHKLFQSKLPTFPKLKAPDFTPEDVGIIPTATEREIENPSKKQSQNNDGIHFFGTDSENNVIDVCINKIGDDLANVWVFLNLSNGEKYRLPGGADTRRAYIHNEFTSNGLQIKCLIPLRKWRISFNGLLQKFSSDHLKEIQLVHVRFSFIFLSLSQPQELNTIFNNKVVAKSFAEASCQVNTTHLKRFHGVLKRYVQWGQLMGVLNIKGTPEKELYMWTYRTRILDESFRDKETNFDKMYMYFLDGYPMYFENVNSKDLLSNYLIAHTVNGLGGMTSIADCDLDFYKLHETTKNLRFSCKMNNVLQNVSIQFTNEQEMYVGVQLEQRITVKHFRVQLDNGDTGYGIVHLGSSSHQGVEVSYSPPPILLKEIDLSQNSIEKSIVLLEEEACRNYLIAGGKGSSLALLNELSKTQRMFHVPKGFVITTKAYENHIKNNESMHFAIQNLLDISGEKKKGDLKESCSKCVKEFQNHKMSNSLRDEIQKVILSLYESVENVRFSVRSSACGEDSEDLSAAGQMLTVLGVRGINNIVDAVIKCWSSKFGFEAVQYARQNGQPIRSPMAVVVQEMVASEVSGVLFTVDPVTGDPSNPYITANYGLGETVVSSLAEPDTIVLQRHSNNTISVKEQIIGSKKTQVHMQDGEGTVQKALSCETLSTCLNDEWSVIIGSVGILVEDCFCSPRDIEWALHKDKLYLLQARPITTLHTETEFEMTRDQDTPIRSSKDFWTRANTGEVFPGATSPLGISLVVGVMDILGHRNTIVRENLPLNWYAPYFFHVLPIAHRQVMISVIDMLYRFNERERTNFQKSFEVGLFGRIVGTEEMHRIGVKKYGYVSRWRQYFMYTFIFMFNYRLPKMIKDSAAKVKAYKIPFDTYTNTHTTWQGLLSQVRFYGEVLHVHGMTTFISSFWNLLVILTLSRNKEEWDSELYCDFAALLSSCTGVESAEVPESLQKLAQEIVKGHGTTFSSLTPNMACNILENDEGSAGKLFREFLQKHGHRCIKEFDVNSSSWRMDPEGLMPTLQNLVSSPNILNVQSKTEMSVSEVISRVKTPLRYSSKKILNFVLPKSRQAVRQREQTKSLSIKLVDAFRQTCHHLGKFMVEDGMLPDSKLLFFLTLEEIQEMIETQRPGLVSRAMRRKRLHSKLERVQFPEIIFGIPKPIQIEEEDSSKYSESFTLKGIPVCEGKVAGVARVVVALSEAPSIQNGDILITHSTDTGWSPYFPLLSGVVTVLGGLISHGAVVAREYGLPCVVGVEKALTAFKSGDLVILDGTKGTISKVTSNDLK